MNRKNLIWIIVTILIVFIAFVIIQSLNSGSGLTAWMKPHSQANNLDEGYQLIEEHKYEEAITQFTELIIEGDTTGKSYSGRADAYMGLRRVDEAILDYTTALSIQRNATTLASRCNAYRLYSVFDKAAQDCQEALDLDPNNPDALLSQAFLYVERGNYEDARKLISTLISQDPNSSKGYFALARIEMSSGTFEQTVEALNKAIEIDPNEPQFYWERGFLYYSNDMIDESEADMRKLLEIADPYADSELMMQAGYLLNTYSGSRTPEP
jgi:tetratricopeptide (TPR) repeat protein